jgi:RNA polymerase sigma-70 factor (ECF subfamily)
MEARTLTNVVEPEPVARARGTIDRVAAARAGDAGAFESLVQSRIARTYRIAISILGSEVEASDAVQEAWISASRQLPNLVDPSRFDAWLDQILVDACRMSVRRRGQVREIAVVEEIEVRDPQPGPDRDGERQALSRAFDGLTLDERMLLVLHHLEQWPLAAIADSLDIPVGTAKSRLHAARAALGRLMEAER